MIYAEVNLEDQRSIELFGSTILDKWSWVDGLVNNASTLGVGVSLYVWIRRYSSAYLSYA